MSKPLFLTAVLCLMLQVTSFAQSIKLNNQTDPGSAMLEVSSPSKGILIPNVTLTGSTDATTIASPAVSLLVYNTATVSDIIPGYYYNSGTAVLPEWSRLSTVTSGDGSETKVTAGTNVTVTGSGTSASPYIIDAAGGVGTNTTNYLSKWNGSALVSSSIFDNGTSVGLGTPNPLKKMHVQSGGTSLLTSSYGDGMLFSSNSVSGARIFLENLSGAENEKSLAIVNENVGGKGTTYFGSLSDDGSTWIRDNILSMDHSSGNIGIGTAPTTEKLHVNGNVKVAGIISGVTDPVSAQDAATKAYVDSNDDTGTDDQTLAEILTTNTSAGSNKITSLADPVSAQDAATKVYVDLLEAKLEALEGVKDIDNNKYDIITIGTQTWMAENLKTTRYNDGTVIPLITDGTAWGTASTNKSRGYCWYNAPNESTNLITYGALYNWYTISTFANGNKNVCPTGWHVPTDVEWTTLSTYLGGEGVAGGKMKEAGLAHWTSPNTGATNESGFAGLSGGFREDDGAFFSISHSGGWWSSASISWTNAWNRGLSSYNGLVYRNLNNNGYGYSVRCLRD